MDLEQRKRVRLSISEDEEDQVELVGGSRRRFCSHCSELVSCKTFKYHKRLYYNKESHEWTKVISRVHDCGSSTEEESPPPTPTPLVLEQDIDYSPSPPEELDLGSDSESEISEPGDDDDDEYEIWNISQDEVADEFLEEVPMLLKDSEFQTPGPSITISRWIILFIHFMQSKFKLSDAATSVLLKFLGVLLTVLSTFSETIARIANNLPPSLYLAKLIQDPPFKRYTVCWKCHSIYSKNDSIEVLGQIKKSKQCSFSRFPHHPQARMRAPCGSLLLKTVELAGGCTHLYPFLTYCYLSLEISMQILLNRPYFYDKCEEWRKRNVNAGMLCDIYDGKVWNNFFELDNKPFLSEPGNFGLMLNIDFFQPFKHVTYSLGAIYATVMNLPRNIRNKQENVILIGIIPGPHEPKHDFNSFLDPLVNDLIKFLDGIELTVPSLGCKKIIHCALLCIACDLSAGRKACGFLGHSAQLGCSECLKKFSGSVGNMDYSGFEREKWPLRSVAEHRKNAESILDAKTLSERDTAESALGCRYSVLLKLPYFDAPRMLVVDPMHNLFLGSAKHFMKDIRWVWNH